MNQAVEKEMRHDQRRDHGVDFAVEEGGITTILGANGAGKTTTLRAVCGMVRTAGEIRFDGRSIAGRATEDLVRLGDGGGPLIVITFLPTPLARAANDACRLHETLVSRIVVASTYDGLPVTAEQLRAAGRDGAQCRDHRVLVDDARDASTIDS